jgi:ubiquinone/menaquinone biosynthesis C-methylase UbiE
MHHQDHVNLLQPANLPPAGTWADFGAGSGAFTLALRDLVGPQATLYAVDRDRFRLKDLERNFRDHFGDTHHLTLLEKDFNKPFHLPLLDGLLMANSLHFYKGKEEVLRTVGSHLRSGGMLLLVEYNVDSGNPWVPYPLSFETFRRLAPPAGFSEPRLLATHKSSFLKGFYSALCTKIANA